MAGTIPLPSPYPASGKVFLIGVWHPHEMGSNGQTHGIDFYLKSVQVISERNTISRTLEIDSVRAVGFHQCSEGNGQLHSQNGNGAGWAVVPVHESKRLADAMQRFHETPHESQQCSSEVLLYENAVLYVREAAPVLHHQELGITAAVSAEAGSMLADMVSPIAKGCC